MERSGASMQSDMQSPMQERPGTPRCSYNDELGRNAMTPPSCGSNRLSRNLMQYKHNTPPMAKEAPSPKDTENGPHEL